MIEVLISVKSSSNPDEPYTINFIREDGKVSVFCSCPAGIRGQLCKHKTGLIENNEALLFDAEEVASLVTAHQLIMGTSMLDVYQDFKERKDAIEAQQKKLKKELSGLKSGFGRQLQEGIE
jgi:hypothetical protein